MAMREIMLGRAKISSKYLVSLPREVAAELKVIPGDYIVFIKKSDGKIYIESIFSLGSAGRTPESSLPPPGKR